VTSAARHDRIGTLRTRHDRRARRAAARVLGIPARAVDFDVRGFAPAAPAVRAALEQHGRSFAAGFNAALAAPLDELEPLLGDVPAAERGFAFEGAAMALALFDLVVPGAPRRLPAFCRGIGAPHVYMAHVGAGWALARLRLRPWGRLGVDPLLRWLALDGYGFHEAFFHPAPVVRGGRRPSRLDGYELRAFDQGVGRALWFVEAADAERIAATVRRLPAARRGDLWSGVGLAAAYAGAADDDTLLAIRDAAGPLAAHVAQGAAFAAAARVHARNVVPHTATAVRIFCDLDLAAAARVTDAARPAAPAGAAADYESWRASIRRAFALQPVPA
jgi:hypothetical protein